MNKKTASDKALLATFTAGHIVDDIYMNTLPPLVPVLVTSAGFSYSSAGLLVMLFTVTSSIAQPFFGYAADKYGLGKSGGYGLMWAAFFMSLIGISNNHRVILLAAMLAGIGPAMFHTHALTAISGISTSVKGRIMSIFLIGGNLGFALGPVLVGALTKELGLGGIKYIAIPGILMGLYLWMKDCGSECSRAEKMHTLRLRDFSPAVTLVIVAVLRSWVYFSILSYIPSYLMTQGNSVMRSNFQLTLMLLAGVAGQFTGGSLSDKYGRKEVTMVSLIAAAPLLYLFLHTSGAVSSACLLLFGFFVMASFSITIVMIQEIMHRHVGIASGIMIGFAVGMGGIGVLVTGHIADAFGLAAALNSLPLLTLVAGILVWFVRYKEQW